MQEKSKVAQNIGVYKHDKTTNTYPVFVNYNKEDNISDSIKYEDRFESPDVFKAISKNNRTLSSKDIQTLIDSKENNTKILLFLRKNKDDKESKEFYYLGEIYPKKNKFKSITVGGKPAVEIKYQLETSVKEELYTYLIG